MRISGHWTLYLSIDSFTNDDVSHILCLIFLFKNHRFPFRVCNKTIISFSLRYMCTQFQSIFLIFFFSLLYSIFHCSFHFIRFYYPLNGTCTTQNPLKNWFLFIFYIRWTVCIRIIILRVSQSLVTISGQQIIVWVSLRQSAILEREKE